MFLRIQSGRLMFCLMEQGSKTHEKRTRQNRIQFNATRVSPLVSNLDSLSFCELSVDCYLFLLFIIQVQRFLSRPNANSGATSYTLRRTEPGAILHFFSFAKSSCWVDLSFTVILNYFFAVWWCRVGGVDTWEGTPSRVEVQQKLQQKITAARSDYEGASKSMKTVSLFS